VRLAGGTRAPHLEQQLAVRHDLPDVLHQRREQVVLGPRQADLLVPDEDAPRDRSLIVREAGPGSLGADRDRGLQTGDG
jgi:hypothetical protein